VKHQDSRAGSKLSCHRPQGRVRYAVLDQILERGIQQFNFSA